MRIDRRTARRFILAGAAVAAVLAPHQAAAQDEGALRAFFEGKPVTLRIDMPGTEQGVDVRADAGGVMDSVAYGSRIKTYGPSISAGERVPITLVKIKKDLIEFQLGGGGFGTFGDDTSTSVYMPLVEKSRRELDLEKRVREEDDRRIRRELQKELDELRDERERANRRIEAEKQHLEELKRERVAAERQHGGSRFNLRFTGSVPRDIRPEDVMAALAEYVDFSEARGGPPPPIPASFDASVLKKGMAREDVERALGRPVQASERRDGGLVTTTMVFASGSERVTVDFVEDVLVRYTIASR